MSSVPDIIRRSTFVGVKELADAAESVLRHSALSQDRGTVADYPKERSLRYYISEGLISQASGKRGLNSLFGYDHLLTVLAIKKLQSEGVPINLIKTLIEGKDTAELELVVGDELLSAVSLALGGEPPPMPMAAAPGSDIQFSLVDPPKAQNRAKGFLQSLLFQGTPESRPEDSMPLLSVSSARPAKKSIADEPSRWDRYEIQPGFELHINERYAASDPDDPRPKLHEMIEKILRKLGR